MLNTKQKEAVEYLDGPLLVLAGPGTGKTQLLSEKVAYILKNTDTNPENILCLTFTETGATNMKERLKTVAKNEGAKVNVSTYHAFGTEILTKYRNYSENYDRKLDSAIDEVTQFKIISELQDHLPAKDILRGDKVKDIIEAISSAKSAGLSSDDLLNIAEQNLEDSKVLSEAISPLLQNIVPRAFRESFNNAYKPIYTVLESYAKEAPTIQFGTHSRAFAQAYGPKLDLSSPIERIISTIAKDLKEAIIEAESNEKIKPLSAWKDKYFEKDEKGNYRLKDRVANKKLISVAKIMADYNQYLKDQGLYDFDDMIEEAVQILKTDDGFRLTLEECYQFIMLDEFQDTNPSQFAIIKELTNYEKPMIMAVGDDDQAIYEFQGALSTNLTDFQKHYNAHVVALVENYRSTQEILDFSHEIIAQAPDRFADKELFATKKNPAKTEIHRHEFLSSDMEYDFVASEIEKLIKSGVPQNEIAVISYKTKYFLPLLPYLKSRKLIKIAYEKQDNLFEDDIMHQIFAIARFAYETKNNIVGGVSPLEILSYPFFKLPVLEIVKLTNTAERNHRSMIEALANAENPKIQTVVNFLANLSAKAFVEPLEIMLDYIIGSAELDGFKSPLLEYYAKDDDYQAFTLYENLASLRGKLKKHFGEKNLKLDDLISMLDDYEAAEMSINKTSPYRDAKDAVQILTAHKAKGLEFSYVFIISADHIAWGKGKGNNNLLSLPKNLMHIRHTGTTDGEKLRILYVALTRAKNGLYITNSLKDYSDKKPERLEYLNEYVEDGKVISPYIPEKEVICHYQESAEDSSAKTEVERLKHWISPFVELTPDMRAIYEERIKNWRMSASSLTSFIDVVYAGPVEFFKRQILRAPSDPETEAMAFGDLIHKTFEEVANHHISEEKAIEYFLKELEKKELSNDVVEKIRERGPADLAVSLKAFNDILKDGKAEVNFFAEKVSVEGVPITGKIDHITIDEDNKTIEIYDFKTGGYHKEKWHSHATLYKYMLQLGFYKLLLNNSPTYSKYKIEKAHILFVTPDKDNEVYDKVYEFNEKDERELIDLIKSVYQAVTTLKFMDDRKIFVPANNNLGVKDIREFVALMLAKTA